MKRDEVLLILRANEKELRDSGVTRLQIFGSVARDEANEQSDVDVLADFDPDKRLSLLGVASIQVRLEEILETSVDLSSPTWLKERLAKRALREAVLVF